MSKYPYLTIFPDNPSNPTDTLPGNDVQWWLHITNRFHVGLPKKPNFFRRFFIKVCLGWEVKNHLPANIFTPTKQQLNG